MSATSDAIADVYGLTPLQKGMLYHALRDPGAGQYVLQQTFLVEGRLPASLARDAMDVLAVRHDVLRTAFVVPRSSGRARQVVLARRQPDFRQVDLSDRSPAEQERELTALRDADVARGFDLERDPLIRLTHVRLGPDRQALVWALHHIVADGWSLPIVLGDFLRWCADLAAGTAPDEAAARARAENQAAAHFGDYVRWLGRRDQETALRFWDDQLAGHGEPRGIPALRPPLAQATSGVEIASLRVPADTVARLTALAGAEGVTASTWLGAAWGLLLQRHNNADDVVFGTVVSGRDVPLAGVDRLPGLFINTVPTRVRTRPGQTLRAFLVEQQEQALAAAEHSQCALADIQRRAGDGLFSTILALENYYVAPHDDPAGFTVTPLGGREQTNYPVSLRLGPADGGLRVEALYDPALYDGPQLDDVLRRFGNLVAGFAQGLDQPVAQILESDQDERRQVLALCAGAALDDADDAPATLGAALDAAVAAHADRVALRHGASTVTYARLGARVDALARRLRTLGVAPDRLVAISGRRRAECVIAILATIKAGGAFLALDPDDPRSTVMLAASRPAAVLDFGGDLGEHGLPGLDLLCVCDDEDDAGPLADVNRPDDLAYCIYTSGTTGRPKGVLIEHRGVVNLARQVAAALELSPDDRMLKFSNHTFDVSVWEIFVALLNGAELVLLDEDVIMDNQRFLEYTRTTGVTTAVLPPPYFRQSLLPGLPKLVTGGSAAGPDLVARAAQAGGYANGYGPTEVTVASHLWRHEPGRPVPATVPIGRPFPGVSGYVLQDGRLCGVGVPGELCVGGVGVARGYLGDPDQTAARFVPNPYGPGRLYRTGDLARLLPSGDVEYLGRLDDQVKVRGFRVELGEVENALRALPDVADAVVVAQPDASGLALHAYLTSPSTLDLAALRRQTRDRLPGFMVPALFRQIDAVPLDSAGKPDRHALAPITPTPAPAAPPATPAQEQALRVFEDVLGVRPLGVDADFFDHGGDSFKAIQIAARLAGQGLTTSVREIFSLRTVAAIVADAESVQAGADDAPASTSGPDEPLTAAELDAWCARADLGSYAERIDAEPIAAVERPLLMAQRAMLDLDVLASCGFAEIRAPFDADRLATAWARLLASAPQLRGQLRLGARPATRTGLRDGCGSAPRLPIPRLDLSGLGPTQRTQVLNRLATRLCAPYLDPRRCADRFLGVHRVLAVLTAPDRFLVLMPVSHLVFDGFSNAVLAHRLTALYTTPDQPAAAKPDRDDYEAFVREGPQGVDDDGLVAALDLEHFAARADAWRAEPWSRHEIAVPIDAAMPADALIELAQSLCATALAWPQPSEPVPYLLVSSARRYAGGTFSDDVGAYLDVVPVVWETDRPFEPNQRRALDFVRDHRVNTLALLYDDGLAERFPRAAALLRAAIPIRGGRPDAQPLGRLGLPLVNLLVLYGAQLIAPEPPAPDGAEDVGDDRRVFLDVSVRATGPDAAQLVLRNVRLLPGQADGLRERLTAMAARARNPRTRRARTRQTGGQAR